MTLRPAPAYAISAAVYDRVYSWKDYGAEARRVRALIRRYGPPDAHTLLDVACGTGEHLETLSRWFETAGVDASAAMLAVARKKLPRVRFVRSTMQTFRFDRQFDAITCLFSAIGYVRTPSELRRTLRNFAGHLRPGGVVLVEPWIAPEDYRPGAVHLGKYGTAESPIARMNISERRGGRSIMDMHYLMPYRGRVRHWVERHEMGLFDDATMRDAFVRAGLTVRRVPSRFTTNRGLYVGVKPWGHDRRSSTHAPGRRRAAPGRPRRRMPR